MKHSTDRILTTHVGSLPRPAHVAEMLLRRERGDDGDPDEFDRTMADAVAEIVKRQVSVGVDVVSDGEMSKIGYATYIKDRLTGFEGDAKRKAPRDVADYPDFLEASVRTTGAQPFRRPPCVGPIEVRDREPLRKDLANFRAALSDGGPVEAFMTAASPGVISAFQPNSYYPTHEAYIDAIAGVMTDEYEAIFEAGFILQLDCPDLAMARHTAFQDVSETEFLKRAEHQVGALNAALANIPSDSVRMHICWGNYEGPHHHDIALEKIMAIVLKAKPAAISFEAANPRHEHEWVVWRDTKLPDDKVLLPGVLDSTTNFVEHPELVAQRLCRFAEIVGRERVLASSDCGFGTFAGYGKIDPEISFAKLEAMVEGAAIASDRLWH